MNIPKKIQNRALILPDSRKLHSRRIPASTIMDTYADAVRVRMNSSAAIPMQKIHQPEKPSLYITNMNPT